MPTRRTPLQVNERLTLLEQRVEYPEVVVVGGGYAGEHKGRYTALLPAPAFLD